MNGLKNAISRAAFFATAALLCAAALARSPAERAAFVRQHHCPSTGKAKGACPGWVVDHIVPLCAGGADAPGNMQWQRVKKAKAKDKKEWKQCRLLRRKN